MQVVILSGFLGSGKTSLLMGLARFLAREATKGDAPRVIILENEVGDKGVDDALLKKQRLSGGKSVCGLCLLHRWRRTDPGGILYRRNICAGLDDPGNHRTGLSGPDPG